MSLNIRYASKGEVIDKERATRSYYSRHELQARASRGVPKGTTIRKSIARPQDWGGQGHLPGGAIQYEIRDFDWKTMGDWFQELGPINNYIGK